MRITTRAVCGLAALGILALNSETLGAKAKVQADRTANRMKTDAIAAEQTEAAKAAAKLSAVALERAKSCRQVIDPVTRQPMALIEGQGVTSGVGVSVRLTKRLVCNSIGDTAYANEAGVVQVGSIASATAEDLAEYQRILKGEKPNGSK
jgi:predicted flap endonuclease-1-like 5' DNA nuclease